MALNENTPVPPTGDTPCKHCGYPGPHTEIPDEQHYARLDCGQCGRYVKWLPIPDAEKRRDRNPAHRSFWVKHHGGDLVCHWCLVRKSETNSWFVIDHIQPLERGGLDELENTRPLCSPCHAIRHALELHSRHHRGLSARESAA